MKLRMILAAAICYIAANISTAAAKEKDIPCDTDGINSRMAKYEELTNKHEHSPSDIRNLKSLMKAEACISLYNEHGLANMFDEAYAEYFGRLAVLGYTIGEKTGHFELYTLSAQMMLAAGTQYSDELLRRVSYVLPVIIQNLRSSDANTVWEAAFLSQEVIIKHWRDLDTNEKKSLKAGLENTKANLLKNTLLSEIQRGALNQIDSALNYYEDP